KRFEPDSLFQVAQLAFSAPHLEFARVAITGHGDPGRIVSAILQLLEPVNNHGHNPLFTYVTNDSTHNSLDSGALSRDSHILLRVSAIPSGAFLKSRAQRGIPISFENSQVAIKTFLQAGRDPSPAKPAGSGLRKRLRSGLQKKATPQSDR